MTFENLQWLSKQKACPVCGGDATVVEVEFDDGDVWFHPECSCCKMGWQENFPTIKEAVEAWNEVDARPAIHAEWELGGIQPWDGVVGNWVCSNCGYVSLDPTKYCGDCGSRMDLENDGTDLGDEKD